MAAGDDWGRGHPEHPRKVIVEYVSANPTGPLTAASGRHAAYGDALARLLELRRPRGLPRVLLQRRGLAGHRLGESVRARARKEPVPEDGYQGDYVAELAERSRTPPSAIRRGARRKAAALIMESIRATLTAYRVEFDSFFLEGSLHEGDPSPIAIAYELLREHGHLYESEGALWLRTSAFGDDKDRVLERSTGAPTYFAADVAYHENKVERGFDLLIDVLGADHHGYIGRMKGVMEALGDRPGPARDADPAVRAHRRGRRPGEDVQAPRRLRHARRADRRDRRRRDALVHDLALARLDDRPRPRARAQAGPREPGLLRPVRACADRVDPAQAPPGLVEAALASEPQATTLNASERELIRQLLEFPNEVREAVERRAPHRIAGYALELGQAFAAFYRDSPVLKEPDAALQSFRIALCVASQRTLAAALGLLGVSAPEAM